MNNLIEQDKEHRAQALNPHQSFIVQAPAGSGKTELLIQRFLSLLTQVKSPEEILAITFTKKAANEMRSRIIKALKKALHEPEPDSAHHKKTWLIAKKVLERDEQHQWQLINNPNQLHIKTIDALCSYLTKQLPLLSHFGSQPDIADNPQILYREAVQEVLMHVEENYDWSEAISLLLLHVDNDLNKLHDLLVALLAKRDQWLPYIQLSSNDTEIKAQLENQLGLVITDTLTKLQAVFPKNITEELLAIARFAAAHLQHSDSEIAICESLTQLPGVTPKDKSAWLGLAKLLLTKSFSWRKRVDEEIGFPTLKNISNPQEKALNQSFRQRLITLITTINDREEVRTHLSELFFLPEAHYNIEQWEILQALLHVLKIVVAQLRLTFQQYGQIDFIENTQAALAALGSDEHPTDLALALDYQIQHILIDEFQDTSYTQHQLLKKLIQGWEPNDGRTLFVVGDPMQSIYRFREAEVGLFIRMRQYGIHHLNLIPLTLAVNFRSTSTIVEWNNEHFQFIFPSFNDIASGAVSYSPSVASNATDKQKNDIYIKGYINAAENEEANQLISLIQQTKEQYPKDNIAILVRSRSHLKAIIPALKKAELAYRAVDIDPLASRQHIQDLLSLTCALLHPADRIAWLAILRAPWCGLSLADLLMIAGLDPYAAIYNQLQQTEIRAKLSLDGQQRITKILSILSSQIVERERSDLRTWVENTWLLLGGPASLINQTDLDDTRAFFGLLQEFSQQYPVIQLDKLKERINQLYASTGQDDATLQIMTIHTAKGLEFDTVILPQLDRTNPNDDKALLLWMERPLTNQKTALLLAPLHATGKNKDSIYEYISRQQRIKSDYETDRLLYVATTRAKKRLYLSFNSTHKADHQLKIESGSFLEKMWPQLERNKQSILHIQPQQSDHPILVQRQARPIQRFISTWKNPIEEVAKNTIAYHQQGGFHLTDITPQLIGTVTHRILQQLSHAGIAWWEKNSLQAKMAYIHAHLKQSGVSPDKLIFAADSVQQSIQNTLQDARGQWILYTHTQAKSEYAITTIMAETEDETSYIENYVIDRTFIDDKGTLWIIDYKTTTLTHHDLDYFLNNEKQKYYKKMQRYAIALGQQYSGSIRLGLYFPALPAWLEWDA